MLIVFTTAPNVTEAESLAERIVETKLAACVQLLPQMTSVYVWEGKIQKESEYLLLIKTLPDKWDELHSFITGNHSYDVPEIIAVDADKIVQPYADWLKSVLDSK